MSEEDENIVMNNIPLKKPKPTPKDLHTLYMDNLLSMQEECDFNALYSKLLFSIDIGKDMLLDKYDNIREEAENILLDRRSYPGTRDIRISSTGDSYQINTSDGAGQMKFRIDGTSELKEGIEDIKTQQATMLIPRLKKIDSKIRRALQQSKIIKIKRPDIEEIFMEELIEDVMNETEGESEEEIKVEEEIIEEPIDDKIKEIEEEMDNGNDN